MKKKRLVLLLALVILLSTVLTASASTQRIEHWLHTYYNAAEVPVYIIQLSGHFRQGDSANWEKCTSAWHTKWKLKDGWYLETEVAPYCQPDTEWRTDAVAVGAGYTLKYQGDPRIVSNCAIACDNTDHNWVCVKDCLDFPY